jgi:UDP-N-acetylmuramoyl-L-alanyl-D-glutamate--2,6-diaminopimelate ligase
VPGRFNVIETPLDCFVIVDYAHSPDGLKKILTALRQISNEKIVCIFGCGGNRDITKRPIMGKIASEIADHVIITSDNPRFEKAEDIARDIEGGVVAIGSYEIVLDRREAIVKGLEMAGPEDIVLIAGKGSEDYQEINGVKHPFFDADVVKDVAKDISKGGARKWARG